MKQLYTIIGVSEEFDSVRLTLQPKEFVKEKNSQEKIFANPFGFIESMKRDALQINRPEAIVIPKEEWLKHKWNINDMIFVEVLPND